MNNHASYEDVIRELEELNEKELDSGMEDLYNGDFRFEYAFEGLTEKRSAYKKRISNV